MLIESSKKAGRVVRYVRRDGTAVTKTYAPYVKRGTAAAPITQAAPTHQTTATDDPNTETVADLIAAWRRSEAWENLSKNTRITYGRALRHLSHEDMANTLATKASRKELLKIVSAVTTAFGHGAAGTLVTACQSMFRWAVDQEWIGVTPARDMRRNIKYGVFPAWSKDEYELAERHLPELIRRAVVLAAYTVQRRGDLVKMKWSDYDGTTIHVIQEKTGAEVWVPVHPALKAELEAWRPAATVVPIRNNMGVNPNDGTILITRTGRPWTGNNVSAQLQNGLEKIPGFPTGHNIHGLRKLGCTLLAEAGATTQEIQAWSGHKTTAQVQHYTESANKRVLAISGLAKLMAHR
jgi:integrase